MTSLVEKIVALDVALDDAGIAHAFGGALALAWCTERARGTIDIDLNVFAPPDQAATAFDALPPGVARTAADLERAELDGQVRLWWDSTPVDLFLSTADFHEHAAERVRTETFAGRQIPFLGCSDLAVFKAFFNRTKDWADLEEILAAGTLDVERVLGVLVLYLGPDDDRVARLRSLVT